MQYRKRRANLRSPCRDAMFRFPLPNCSAMPTCRRVIRSQISSPVTFISNSRSSGSSHRRSIWPLILTIHGRFLYPLIRLRRPNIGISHSGRSRCSIGDSHSSLSTHNCRATAVIGHLTKTVRIDRRRSAVMLRHCRLPGPVHLTTAVPAAASATTAPAVHGVAGIPVMGIPFIRAQLTAPAPGRPHRLIPCTAHQAVGRTG